MGRRPYLSARTGPEGLLGSRPPPDVPADWTALSVDGSHIDVDRHLPLRCHLINLGGCAITYGQNQTSAASCSANPPWPWTTPTCTSVPPTEHPAKP